MTTYKLTGNDYQYPYFCTNGGDIFYNDDNDKTVYPQFGLASREVDERHYGKLTKYVSVPLLHKDGGRTPAADAGEMIARSVIGIDMSIPGFVRLKDKNLHNIHIDNMEFVQTARYTGEIIAVWDENGRTVVDEKLESTECAGGIDKPSMTILPTKHTFGDPPKKEHTDSTKSDLTGRDRSLVAEVLYILIEDRGFTAAEALDTLMLDDSTDALALYLEGRDSVYKTSDETIAKVNQERDKSGPTMMSGLSGGSTMMPSFKPGPQTYVYTEGETDVK